MEDDEQEDVDRVRDWIGRLQAFASSIDDIDGTSPDDFGENVCEARQNVAMSDMPPKTSPAVLIALETLNALLQVMRKVVMDWANTPDVRDRLTRDGAQQLAEDAMADILRDGQRWLSEGMPSLDQIQGRIAAVVADIKDAGNEVGKRNAEFDKDDTEAAADRYGVILGYHDPNLDANIIFDTGDDNKRYLDAYDRLRRMLDRELMQHIYDESDVLSDVLIGILSDLRDNRISLTDEDAIDERRRRLRSALVSVTSALQIHQEQAINKAKKTFGRNTPQAQAVEDLFNDLKKTSFDYCWLEELRDALAARRHQCVQVRLHGTAAR